VDDSFDRLWTSRLVIRRFTGSDAVAFSAYRSVPDVARYQSWTAPYPLERAEAFIAWLDASHPDMPGEWYQLAVAERAAPAIVVGDIGFRARADEPAIVDIGFTLGPSAQGRGYATEAVGEVVRYLFEDRAKHKVCADCDTRNDRSWRLMERIGLRREGTLRESVRDGEGWASEHLYGLVAADWREHHRAPPVPAGAR
jgi:RimJ/RimL family protein N-acetyltransferase